MDDDPLQSGPDRDRTGVADGDQAVGSPTPVGGPAATVGRAVLTALPAWVAARVVVLVTLGVAHAGVGTLRPHDPAALLRVHQGLLAWDGGWYESIARHGYAASGIQSVRFFPAFPLAGRWLGAIPGIGVGAALVVLANLCSLGAMAGLVLLVERDLGDPSLARRSAWLLALAPAAYVLTWGYSDGPLLLCSVGAFLGARSGRWWWAAGFGLVAGLLRPVGILLMVPLVIEVFLDWRRHRPSGRGAIGQGGGGADSPPLWAGWTAALVAPAAGTAIFLGWVGSRFGSVWLPFHLQEEGGHRGAFTVPVVAMAHDLSAAVHGHHLGSALHVPWVVVTLALVVVAFRRLPLSYGAFAAAVLVVSLSSSNLDSFERYALGAFPLVVAASTLTARRPVEIVVLVVATVGMAAYTLLALLGVVVP